MNVVEGGRVEVSVDGGRSRSECVDGGRSGDECVDGGGVEVGVDGVRWWS